jgi:hypothetical protein
MMARVRYVDEDKRFYAAKQALVEPAQEVIAEYAAPSLREYRKFSCHRSPVCSA